MAKRAGFRMEAWRPWLTDSWKQMRPSVVTKYGHSQVMLRGRMKLSVHRLVLEAFLGPCPELMEGCHNDGDASNNRLENLRWDTKKNNHADKIRHGTSSRGERQGRHKLTSEEVRKVRKLHQDGCSIKSLSASFGVATATIYSIVNRKTWAHI